jgi:hypothetical protein
VTVTFTSTLIGFGGTTPGLQVPANITTLNGFADTAGNVPSVLGSSDRLIDNEFLTGPSAPPTVADSRVANNVNTTDFSDIGDAFVATFSEAMTPNPTATILIQDQDGTLAMLSCGVGAACTWNAAATTVTVTVIGFNAPNAGTIPGMQIPMTLAMLSGIAGNSSGLVPDLAGSADVLINFE